MTTSGGEERRGFIAVRCPNEKVKSEAWKVLKPRQPVVARYYSFGGIEHLVGEN